QRLTTCLSSWSPTRVQPVVVSGGLVPSQVAGVLLAQLDAVTQVVLDPRRGELDCVLCLIRRVPHAERHDAAVVERPDLVALEARLLLEERQDPLAGDLDRLLGGARCHLVQRDSKMAHAMSSLSSWGALRGRQTLPGSAIAPRAS